MRLTLTKVFAALAPFALAATTIAVAPQSAEAAASKYVTYTQTLPNNTKVPARWNGCQNVITYKVNLAAVPAKDRNAFLAETLSAFRTLSSRTGFKFSYKGQTSEVPRSGSSAGQSAEIVVAYTTPSKTNYSLAGSTAGRGGFLWYWAYKTVNGKTSYQYASTRGWVVIDTPQVLSQFKPGFGVGVRRGNLLLHELGHVVGLNHAGDPRQVMYPAINRSTPATYNPTGDVVGLSRVGRKAGCLATTWLPTKDMS